MIALPSSSHITHPNFPPSTFKNFRNFRPLSIASLPGGNPAPNARSPHGLSSNIVGAIVVARWFGGVLLGPVRFDHIRNCAHDAIGKWKAERVRPAKQVKLQEDSERRERLAATLKERDESIAVLRELLKQKKGQQSASEGTSPQTKAMDYGPLPLAALVKLEQVRDATIGWILKEIEKAEKA
ncbi:MAG: hypothetical protein Q9173_001832 [Seirophora scorigena]